MGYTTDFNGYMTIDPPLTPERASYINKFSDTRRMARNAEKASQMPDPLREAVGLPIGQDGGYFLGGVGFAGQGKDDSVTGPNDPPAGQPSLWCQWVITEEGSKLEWDCGEKFYEYARWLDYIQEHFLTPWGSKLTGQIDWSGEDENDIGVLYASDGRVEEVSSTIHNPGPSWGGRIG